VNNLVSPSGFPPRSGLWILVLSLLTSYRFRPPPLSFPLWCKNRPSKATSVGSFLNTCPGYAHHDVLLFTDVAHFKVRYFPWPSYTQYKAKASINKLGYLKDSNAAAHSVDSDIFNAVIHLSARSKTYINCYFSK